MHSVPKSDIWLCALAVVLVGSMAVRGQTVYLNTWKVTPHNQGKIQVSVNNIGGFGDSASVDIFSGTIVRGITYPRNSGILYGGLDLTVGGVINREHFVTSGEFLPDPPPDNAFKYRSLDVNSQQYSVDAHSNLDILCQYNDSISDPREPSLRFHHPLNIRVYQQSMAWGADNIDDFILVDCAIELIGTRALKDCYVGLLVYPQIRHYTQSASDVKSVMGSVWGGAHRTECDASDSQFICYWMDGDGNPIGNQWDQLSATSALGVTILQHPVEKPRVSFNWSTLRVIGDANWWTPLKRADLSKVGRTDIDFTFGGDENMYFFLSNGYRPFDQLEMAQDHTDQGWVSPASDAALLASGGQQNMMLIGTGPFDLGPGQRAHFTYAIVGGENVHVNPTDFADNWNPYVPSTYYSNLDFSELMTNARWAKWVFDNPGVDTDGDGYFGKYRVCDGDTNWYEGDGVPDFRADIPPPSPKLKVIPSIGKLVLRWNGYRSENAIDPFTKVKDFEGYRVYWALDDRESSYSTLISWDKPNYNRYYLREKPNHTFAWETKDLPFTIDSLRILYGDSFNPLLYTRDNPLHVGDTLYSFTPVDYNLSSFLPDGVHTVYPDAVNPGTDTTLWTEDQLTTEHGSPLPKYYEYEYVIENVLPTVANYISVTSFDFGFAKGNIPSKESSKRENQLIAYAQTSADSVTANNLNVYVYPNPYLWQKDYHSLGFENRDNTQIPDRSHRINFSNLPPKCKISIFSLDGDLIRSWEHDYEPNDPQAMHDAWDLITRNTMLAVAGLYYWVVESAERTQIGKLVIVE